VNVDAVATPLAFVTAVVPLAKLPLAPEAGAAKVTITPLTGLFPASFTVTCNAEPNAVLIGALCGVPAVAVIDAAVPLVLVKAKVAGLVTPDTLAFTEYEPTVEFAVKLEDVATPLALVTAVLPLEKTALAPEPGAVKVTVTPLTGLFPASLTVTWSAEPKAVLMTALCGVPAVVVTDVAAAAVFVRAKLAGVVTPDTLALTAYEPAVEFAVSADEVATPLALVTAVLPLAKVALAPDPGTANVTVTPLTGLFPVSFTVTCSAEPNAVLITALCGVPDVAVMEEGVPAVFVKAKLAGVVTPDTVAVTA